MSNIDQRVVQMQFDNKQFEEGIKSTLTSLDALNKGLKLEGATKGLNDISAATKGFSLAGIAAGIDSIADKFKALSIIGITALSNIVTKAISAGQALVSSLTVNPIKAGLEEYETNLNSIQTILSNTQWQNTGLKDVNAALNELNLYSDKTIYNFSEMARNIGTFTAAGVKLDVSVNAIKGIANLAAISGSSADQASSAMYQLSQALSTGTVKLQDWNSVVNAGMGGKVFQDALIETAKVHGVAVDKIIKDEGSFRDSLQKGWLTSSILTETLSKFTGDLTAAQLKTMGYNDQQIVGILKMGKTAQDAATKIKTFSQLLNTLQESVGSGWANTWQLIFGDFDEAKDLFTNVNNVLGGFISASAKARNQVLGDWKELGGRTAIIDAIANAFQALISVITPIKDAFREIFPAETGKELYDLSVSIRDFAAGLKIGADTADKLQRTFAGVFAVLGIGWDIVKQVGSVLAKLFGIATDGSGGFLEATARVGDFLVALHKAIEEGNGVTKFFSAIGDVLAIPIKLLKTIATAIGTLFNGFDGNAAAKDVDGFASKLEIITKLLEAIASGGEKLNSFIGTLGEKLKPLVANVVEFFSTLGDKITGALKGIDLSDVLSTINTGLFAGLLLVIKQFVDKFKSGDSGLKGIVTTIKDSFEELTNTMKTMQTTLKAATLLEIASAIAILTISVVALSKIDSDGLTRALTAMAVMFTELFSSMAIFEKIGGTKGFLKMPVITAALILLAIAVDLLTIAVKNLAGLDWESLSRGLTGLTVILAELVATVQLMPDDAKMVGTSVALILLATAISILVGAVTDLSGLSWEELGKGLTGVAGLLTALTLFTKFSDADKGGVLQGAGLVLLATGVKILASAVQDLSGLSWEEIAKGLLSLAGALAIIVAALDLIPPTAPLSAAGVLIVAVSLGMVADALQQMGSMSWGEIGKGLTELLGALAIIAAALIVIPPTAPLSALGVLIVAESLGKVADALEQMSKMSWEEIGKSLVELAGALGIIAGALLLMDGALPGAAALLVVSASLAVLAPILQLFGNMSWEEMGKGLLMLAGVFAVLGIAGALLTPVVPTLLLLGVAVTLLGVGMLAAGIGILAFSIAMTALSISGAAGAAAIVAIVTSLVGLIPLVAEQIGLGVIAFAEVISMAGPAILAAITTVLLALINAIVILTPVIVDALYKLILKLLETMANNVPKMVDAGLKLLTGILNGIANNIDGVVTAATNIIVNFINSISKNLPRVIQAGVDMIISFINGLAKAIDNNSEAMGKAGGDLATAIIKGMAKGLLAGGGEVAKAAKDVAKKALDAAKDFLGINSPSKKFFDVGMGTDEGFALGVDKFGHLVTKATENVGAGALASLTESLSGLSDVVSGPIDIHPVITPVLDLSSVKKDASTIGSMFATKPISVDAVYSSAQDASEGYYNNQKPNPDDPGTSSGDTFTYNQYNTSPKALSTGEIYRQTKNQLSVAKGDLVP